MGITVAFSSPLVSSHQHWSSPCLPFQKRQTKQSINVPFKGHLSTSNDSGCWVGSLVGRGFPINQSISNLRLRRELKRVMGRKRGGVCRLPLTHISTHINSTTVPSGAPTYKFTFFVDMNTYLTIETVSRHAKKPHQNKNDKQVVKQFSKMISSICANQATKEKQLETKNYQT